MAKYNKYSNYYDILYEDKNYSKEVDFVEKFIKIMSPTAKRILSLGCGTCNYEIIFAERGYDVTGLDMSRDMLEVAKKKILKEKLNGNIKLVNTNIQNFALPCEFDVSIALFNVLGYQTTDRQITSVLANVHKSLKPGGIFMFDCWYLPAVLKNGPTNRLKEVSFNGYKIKRYTKSTIDIDNNQIIIKFLIEEYKRNKKARSFQELHKVRYWSLSEIENLLKNAGFRIVKTCEFMKEKQRISEKAWNMFVVAQREK